METIQSRFGEIEYDPEKTIYFPHGLLGFENLRRFIVMPNKKNGPLFWIQSTEDPQVAFVLTDPTDFFFDYQVAPGPEERAELEINAEDDCFVLTVVTVTREQEVTLNLCAPLFYSPKTNRALQVIVDDPQFSTRMPLPKIIEKNV